MADDGRAAALRARFQAEQGFWDERWQSVLDADEEFFAACVDLAGVPWREGTLSPVEKELVHIAVAGAATHLYEAGTRTHIRRALEVGATPEQIAETLQLAATLGIHAINFGLPMMVECFREAGQEPVASGDLDERRRELKETFERERGYWHPFWDDLLALSPAFFEAYLNFSAHPWRHGTLEPKLKELIYIAFDAAATHMFVPGTRLHIENAIGYGATPAELLEVLQIASGLGMHALTTGLPILEEELARRQELDR